MWVDVLIVVGHSYVYVVSYILDQFFTIRLSSEAASMSYLKVCYIAASILFGYQVLWAVGEGFGLLSGDLEAVFFLVLDIASRTGLSLVVLSTRPHQQESNETSRYSFAGPDYGTVQRAAL